MLRIFVHTSVLTLARIRRPSTENAKERKALKNAPMRACCSGVSIYFASISSTNSHTVVSVDDCKRRRICSYPIFFGSVGFVVFSAITPFVSTLDEALLYPFDQHLDELIF